jgi:hypothetical protein
VLDTAHLPTSKHPMTLEKLCCNVAAALICSWQYLQGVWCMVWLFYCGMQASGKGWFS